MDSLAFGFTFTEPAIEVLKPVLGGLGIQGELQQASEFVDKNMASDIVVLRDGLITHGIGLRVRESRWINFKGEFTIRGMANGGDSATEIDKIVAGHGDFLFYAFCKPVHDDGWQRGVCGWETHEQAWAHNHTSEKTFICWVLVDLNMFRAHHKTARSCFQENHDGYTGFFAYAIDSFPKGTIVASEGH